MHDVQDCQTGVIWAQRGCDDIGQPTNRLFISAANATGMTGREISQIMARFFDRTDDPFRRVGIIGGDMAQDLEIVVPGGIRPEDAPHG